MYHADFVTGQHIAPGDDVVAFVLACAPCAGSAGYAPTHPSYGYRVASLPLFGRFVEGGAIEVDEACAAAQYTIACRKALLEEVGKVEGSTDTPEANDEPDDEEDDERLANSAGSMADLVAHSPPLAFLRPETFRMLLNLAQEQAFGNLSEALAVNQRLRELLATPEGVKFLELQDSLKGDEDAYHLALLLTRTAAAAKPLGARLTTAKEAFGLDAYSRFEEVAGAFTKLDSSSLLEDPLTGEEFELPAPLYIFSRNYSGRCVSPVLSMAYSRTSDVDPVIEGLLQIQQVDFALMLLGRMWEPSMYKGDEEYPEVAAKYAAHLCTNSFEGVRANAAYAAKVAADPKARPSRYTGERLEALRVLLPKLKQAAAELQSTIAAIEKIG
jgi:hypothetical protein